MGGIGHHMHSCSVCWAIRAGTPGNNHLSFELGDEW